MISVNLVLILFIIILGINTNVNLMIKTIVLVIFGNIPITLFGHPLFLFPEYSEYRKLKNENIKEIDNKIKEKENQKNNVMVEKGINTLELVKISEEKKRQLNSLRAMIIECFFENALNLDEDYVNSLIDNRDLIKEKIEKEKVYLKK